MKKILVTGVTGFIGSHIAEALIKAKFTVIGLKRKSSDTWRCNKFKDKITWIDVEDNFIESIILLKPCIILHCAWSGVSGNERECEVIQQKNIILISDLLYIMSRLDIEKFIALGSQAEYGYLQNAVSEKAIINPITTYGKTKVECCSLVESYCNKHTIDWYWLRLFSFYGPKEAINWFIPAIIDSLIKKKNFISLSACKHKYAYLYIDDLVKYILLLIKKKDAKKGIYNISSLKAYQLKTIAKTIAKQLKNINTKLAFGELPTKANQSILIKGKMGKFHKFIGKPKTISIENGLKKTIKYYTQIN